MTKLVLTSFLAGSVAFGSSTMCYKNNHIDPSTASSIALDGGECDGKFSANDMKNRGYSISDIKITMASGGLNYIFVFKKADDSVAAQNSGVAGGFVVTKEELRVQLEQMQQEQKEETQKKERVASAADGKVRYEQLCKRCHGMGDIVAYNSARPLKSLTKDEFEMGIVDYKNGLRKGSMVILMEPYAKMLNSRDVENIYSYLETLK